MALEPVRDDGVDFTALAVTFNAANRILFVADPNNQPISVPGGIAGNQTLNLINPDYKYPQVLRGNLAYDHDLGFGGLVGTAEVLFSRNLKEINYQNLNYVQAGRADGRPFYGKKVTTFNDAILLTNSAGGQPVQPELQPESALPQRLVYRRLVSLWPGPSRSSTGHRASAGSNFFGVYQAATSTTRR